MLTDGRRTNGRKTGSLDRAMPQAGATKRILSKACIAPPVTNSLKLSVNKGQDFFDSIDLIPKIIMAIYTSVIYSMTNIKP